MNIDVTKDTERYSFLLRDLSKIREETKETIAKMPDYSFVDIKLTDDFRKKFEAAFLDKDKKSPRTSKKQQNQDIIKFNCYTAKVTRASGMDVYIPNIWFYFSPYVIDFYRELGEYKKYYDKVTKYLGIKGSENLKDYANKLFGYNTNDELNEFKNSATIIFSKESSNEEIVNDAVDKLTKFVSNNYAYWGLEDKSTNKKKDMKKINRKDFRDSPVMTILNLIQADQGYVPKIVDIFANDNRLSKYVDNPDSMILSTYSSDAESDAVDINTGEEDTNEFEENGEKKIGENIIFYGVPGSGKSHAIEEKYCKNDSLMERLVFHADYTYSDFVGQLKPTLNTEYNKLEYKFIPGPFTNILKRAISDNHHQYYLIIEEINRGNAPAIFGDIFQLLDRKEDGSSKYRITNEDIAREIYGEEKKNTKIFIPSNLSILATMNTSDQNVFTLDTAFQRRWNMKLVTNEFDESDLDLANTHILDTKIYWHSFLDVVNKKIIENRLGISSSEDKRLGTHFISREDILCDENEIEKIHLFIENSCFAEKVLKYLWDDAFKYSRNDIFQSQFNSLDDLIDTFKKGKNNERFSSIFREDIFSKFKSDEKLELSPTNSTNETSCVDYDQNKMDNNSQ